MPLGGLDDCWILVGHAAAPSWSYAANRPTPSLDSVWRTDRQQWVVHDRHRAGLTAEKRPLKVGCTEAATRHRVHLLRVVGHLPEHAASVDVHRPEGRCRTSLEAGNRGVYRSGCRRQQRYGDWRAAMPPKGLAQDVRYLVGAAAIAAQHMPTQCRGAALGDGRHQLELRQAQVAALRLAPSDADRVDGGFGHPDDACFRPQVEALRRDRDVPSVIDTTMNTDDWGLHTLWNARGVVVLRDVELERSLRHGSRAELRRMGTRVKMAAPIMDRAGPVGLMCVDWMDACEPAGDDRRVHFEEIAAVVLGPVMGTSLRLAGDTLSATRPTHDENPEPFHSLTAAERTVARLAVDGLSYKEIARRLDRSVSTVDHQLRSARSKLGVRSTARLVNLMSGLRSH